MAVSGLHLLYLSLPLERGFTSHSNRKSVLDLWQVVAFKSFVFERLVYSFVPLTHTSTDGSHLVIIGSDDYYMHAKRLTSQRLVAIPNPH